MRTKRENYRYDASGLKGLVLVNVEVSRCQKCGETTVAIPRIEDLHRAIAGTLVRKPGLLDADEIRFLRKYLGWSGVDFASHMGAAPETVSRWESGKITMGPIADRLLRLMVVTTVPVRDYSVDQLRGIGKGTAKQAAMRLKASRTGWAAA